MKKFMTIEMQDGSVWGVPVSIIARNRASYYARGYDGDIEKSLAEDTIPLFEECEYSIEDWVANNMNWSDFAGHQIKISDAPATDFEEGLANGVKGFLDETEIER